MIPYPVPIPFGSPGEDNRLDDARRDIVRLKEVIDDLAQRAEKQAVLLRAVFALLCERQGFTEAELLARFRQVEADRADAPPKRCSLCGRGINLRHNCCLYCDEACEVESAFEFLAMSAWPSLSSQATGRELQPPDKQGITSLPRGRLRQKDSP